MLTSLLHDAGMRPALSPPPLPRIEALPSELSTAILEIYRAFGGWCDAPRLRPAAWDMALDGGLVVELDEELHFNRYRRATLDAEWSSPLPWREDYLRLCLERERDCLAAGRWGKRWTSRSTEGMFGSADPPGEFGTTGAPRWKQRALYDALKDAFGLADNSIRLARITTHDIVGRVVLGAVLDGRAVGDASELAALIERRAIR